MGKKANYVAGGGGLFHTAPVGSHPAIIVGIAELGSADFTYEGVTKHQDEIRIFYEIEADVNTTDEGQPEKIESKVFITEQNYAFKIGNKSNLGKMIAGVYGTNPDQIENFDIEDMLGTKCLVTITHNAKGYSKVDSVSKESSKMNYHTQEAEDFYFSLEDMDNFDEAKFDSFAPFVQKRIKESDEFIAAFGENFESEAKSDLDKEEEELKKEAEMNKVMGGEEPDGTEFDSPDGVIEDEAKVVEKTQAVKKSAPKEGTNPFAKKK